MKKLFLPVLGLSLLLAACGGGTPQTADATAPTVTLDAFQSGATVNLSAAATDNVKVTRVEFYRGSTLISTDDSAPYAATASVSTADNGNVTYTAQAYDAAGNVGQGSKTIAVSVTPSTDVTAPTVSLNAFQSGTSVNLLATATDNVKVTRVEFYRGSTLISTDDSAPYTATASVSTADNGNVTYTAKAYDAAGNVGRGSKVVAVNVTITPPGTQTLYQGVWGWGIVDQGTGALIDNGVVIFNEEDVSEGRKIGLGVYLNVVPGSDQPGNRMGFAVLGPVSGAGKLETVFSLDTASDRVYFGGEDNNDTLEFYQGSLTFEGTGYRFNSSDQPEQQVGILLIQVSDALPNGTAERNALEAKGKALAAQALKATFNTTAQTTAKVNPALFKAMQQRLQLKR